MSYKSLVIGGCISLACLVQCKDEQTKEVASEDDVVETPTSLAGEKLINGEALDKYDLIAIAEHIQDKSPEVVTTPLIEVGVNALATMTPALDSFTAYDFRGTFDQAGKYIDSLAYTDLLPAQQAVIDYLGFCREKK